MLKKFLAALTAMLTVPSMIGTVYASEEIIETIDEPGAVIEEIPTGEQPAHEEFSAVLSEDNAEAELFEEGSALNPYQISTEEDLIKLATLAYTNALTSNYVLKNDIEVTAEEWIPIGNYDTPFRGIFDGAGFTISGIVCDDTDSYVGLFGKNSGTIKNLTVDGVISGNRAGILVGYNSGNIENCKTHGIVSEGEYIGGLVGEITSGSLIKNCWSDATVTTTSSFAGGLIGAMRTETNMAITSRIVNCGSNGDVTGSRYVGGLIGYIYYNPVYDIVRIQNCYSSGKVSLSSINGTDVGGFLGLVSAYLSDSLKRGEVTIKNSYYNYNNNFNDYAFGVSPEQLKNQGTFYM